MLFYFIPTEQHKTDCPPELLAEFLLDDIIANPRFRHLHAGPNNQPGLLVIENVGGRMSPPEYHPDKQTWRQSLDTEAWIGHAGKTPPSIATLARANQLPGRTVKLSNGESITIPHARRFVEVNAGDNAVPIPICALPKTLGRDPKTGEWESREVVARVPPALVRRVGLPASPRRRHSRGGHRPIKR